MEAEEAILARHRVERRDLQNRVTGMKKQATKSTRKQVNSRCEELDRELRSKQEKELRECLAGGSNDGLDDDDELTPEKLLQQLELGKQEEQAANSVPKVTTTTDNSKKRRNRQKERLAKRDAELARMREEAEKEAAEQPNLKQIEQDALDDLCRLKGLKQLDIQADGHCLFASILDQIRLRHTQEACYNIPTGYTGTRDTGSFDVYTLRSLSSNYIRENEDDFVPYLFDEATMTVKDVDEYTKTMEETAQWGGEVELLALAKVLNCCISVMMSGRAAHKVNEQDSKNPELKLVYYKHSFALGEHYNSLHDIS